MGTPLHGAGVSSAHGHATPVSSAARPSQEGDEHLPHRRARRARGHRPSPVIVVRGRARSCYGVQKLPRLLTRPPRRRTAIGAHHPPGRSPRTSGRASRPRLIADSARRATIAPSSAGFSSTPVPSAVPKRRQVPAAQRAGNSTSTRGAATVGWPLPRSLAVTEPMPLPVQPRHRAPAAARAAPQAKGFEAKARASILDGNGVTSLFARGGRRNGRSAASSSTSTIYIENEFE